MWLILERVNIRIAKHVFQEKGIIIWKIMQTIYQW